MESVGFVVTDKGTVLELQSLGGPPPGGGFKMPDLDLQTEGFLYRRKADLDAALSMIEQEAQEMRGLHSDHHSDLRPARDHHDAMVMGQGPQAHSHSHGGATRGETFRVCAAGHHHGTSLTAGGGGARGGRAAAGGDR